MDRQNSINRIVDLHRNAAKPEIIKEALLARGSIMKFYTKAWLLEEHVEKLMPAVQKAYSQHILSLELPSAVNALARLRLGGSYILGVAHHAEHASLHVRLRCGDFEDGFTDVMLTFSQVVVSQQDLRSLDRAMRPAEIGVICDEVDRSGDHFELRMLLNWFDEVVVQFHDVTIETQTVPERGSNEACAKENSITCKLPPELEFRVPTDHVKNCDGGGIVTISLERTTDGTITVEWDDTHFHFLANGKRVSYLRSGVECIYIDRNAKMMRWPICRLDIDLASGGFLLLSASRKHEGIFDEVIRGLQAGPLPFTIHPERPKPKS